jgi:hypothetical protein
MPSLRAVVPSLEASMPAAGLGFAVVVSGGQALAQAPAQVLLLPLSFSNR